MQKYSITLILYTHQQKKSGLYSIALRITVDRKTNYVFTNYAVSENEWDQTKELVKKTHPGYTKINKEILDLKNNVLENIFQFHVRKQSFTSKQLKDAAGKDYLNYFDFVSEMIDLLKTKKSEGTIYIYNRHLITLEDFHGSRNLSFDDIDDKYLLRFEDWFKTTDKIERVKPDSLNNLINHLTTFRTFLNLAKKKKIITETPFQSGYEFPEYHTPKKDVLTLEELDHWEKYLDSLSSGNRKTAASYFLFACYCGLRISDWYHFDILKNIHGDLIRIRPDKTKKHNHWVEMEMSTPLMRCIERIKNNPLKLARRDAYKRIVEVRKDLGLKKNVSPHTARHTFAVTICLENGIPSETAAHLMGINLDTFIDHYSQITPEKINKETRKAWANLS